MYVLLQLDCSIRKVIFGFDDRGILFHILIINHINIGISDLNFIEVHTAIDAHLESSGTLMYWFADDHGLCYQCLYQFVSLFSF